jgi:hypothetical protein
MTRRKHLEGEGACTCHLVRDYVPSDRALFDAAAEDFARELRRLPDPFTGAVSSLNAQDVQWGMNRLRPDHRRLVLSRLGLGNIRPSKCPLSMCEGILYRLDRPEGRFAAQTFSRPVLDAMSAGTSFPERLGCLYLWSVMGTAAHPKTAAGDARTLLDWAKLPWWLPPGVSAEQGEAALTTARAVITASPDFPADHPENDNVRGESPREDLPSMPEATAPAETTETLDPPAANESSGSAETSRTFASGAVEGGSETVMPERLAENLNEAWTAAVAFAAELHANLVSGIVPRPGPFAPLELLSAAASAAYDLTGAESSVPALLEALREEADQAAVKVELAALVPLSGPPDRVSDLTGLIGELLAPARWSQTEWKRARGLLALHRLADLVLEAGGIPADKEEVNELSESASVLPGNAVILVITGQLARPAPDVMPIDAPVESQSEAAPEFKTEFVGVEVHSDDLAEHESLPLNHDTSTIPEPKASPVALEPGEPGKEPHEAQKLTPPVAVAPYAPSADLIGPLAGFVAERRFAAARALAEAMSRPEQERWALRLAALSQAVRSANGSCATRLVTEIRAMTEFEPTQVTLLIAVPALVRAALITGASDTGPLLLEVARYLEPELGTIVTEVGRTVVSGALANAPLISLLADVTELERRLNNARAEATARLTRPHTIRFPRATSMAKIWLDPQDGLLGSLLAAAANDDRSDLERVADQVTRLTAVSELNKEIDRLDHQLRLNGAKALVGGPRQNLIALASGALSAVSAWLAAVGALELQARQDRAWTVRAIGVLRSELLSRRAAVAEALVARCVSDDQLVAAAARAAAEAMEETFALLAGERSLPPGEPPVDLVLSLETLKVPWARKDPESEEVIAELDDAPAVAEVLSLTWPEAYQRHVAAENYSAALTITELVDNAESLPGWPTPDESYVESVLRSAIERTRGELLELRDWLTAETRRARGQSELSEQEDSGLTSILIEADPVRDGRTDLHEVRRQLGEIKERLPLLRGAAAKRLSDRLDWVLAERQKPVDPAEHAQITELIGDGKLSIAEELIYCLDNNADLPEWEPRQDLEAFFPAVPDALPRGIQEEHIAALRSGGKIAGLDVLNSSGLSEGVRGRGADALRDWRLLASTTPDGRGRAGQLEHLLGVLRLAGLEARRIRHLQHGGNTKERRFVEATGIRADRRAILPEFGSKLLSGSSKEGDLKILLAWGRPTADLLMGWIDQDSSGDSLVVAYFGTMTATVRRALAARAVSSAAPVIVLDDAALAYLAIHGEGQVSTALAVTLPFSAVNPYVRDKRGSVAREMFYGRDKERRQILDPAGAQVIYGGRGLGKSALLRDSMSEFERTESRRAIFLDLRDIVGRDGLGASAVWDKLRLQLEQKDLIEPPRAKAARGDSHDAVREGLRRWLAEDQRQRLLVLLDESDGFFESDAPTFVHTQRLKELGTDSDDRVKVVFAGLHSVQRFAKIGRNGPFAHLAQRPVVIGPLGHQHAFDLVAKPLRALGMFIEPDLVHRINGHCAYQPFLLQMFGHRLIELMHQRRTGPAAGPPYMIKEADVEAVISDHGLKGDIIRVFRDTLNLDPRYNVIANVLAHHAYERGMDARLSERDLRAECKTYWPRGFAEDLDFEGFRAYLQEMTGLGVLRHHEGGLGWQLRSVNVLPMIGTPEDVMDALLNASTEQVPHRDHVLQTRRPLKSSRARSPLTAEQIDDLLGEHKNQARVVLGSRATGIQDVTRTLEELTEELGARFLLRQPAGWREFRNELVAGIPGDRQVVMSDLARKGTNVDKCIESLDSALDLVPDRAGVTRSAVLIADPTVMDFWIHTLRSDAPGLAVVLRRHTRSTLKTWALDAERFSAHTDHLFEITSGWPHLVERAQIACDRRSVPDGLDRLRAELETPKERVNLLEATGLGADPRLGRAYRSILALSEGGSLSHPDLVAAASCVIEDDDPEGSVACLLALGLFTLDDSSAYHPEPLVAAAWADPGAEVPRVR